MLSNYDGVQPASLLTFPSKFCFPLASEIKRLFLGHPLLNRAFTPSLELSQTHVNSGTSSIKP